MTKSLLSVLAIALSSLALNGCADDSLVGDWESADKLAGERNEMTIDEDGRGDARIYFFYDADVYYADFDIEWEVDGDDYEIELDCDGSSELDFTMECEISEDETELECEGSDAFDDWEFEWERN